MQLFGTCLCGCFEEAAIWVSSRPRGPGRIEIGFLRQSRREEGMHSARGAPSSPTRPFRHGCEPSPRVIVVLIHKDHETEKPNAARAFLSRNSVSSPVEGSAEVRQSSSTPAFGQIPLAVDHAPRAKESQAPPGVFFSTGLQASKTTAKMGVRLAASEGLRGT